MIEQNWTVIVGASRELLLSLWKTQRATRANQPATLSARAQALRDGELLRSIGSLLSTVVHEFTLDPRHGFHVRRPEVLSMLSSLYVDSPAKLAAARNLWHSLEHHLISRLFEPEPTTEWIPDASGGSRKSGILRTIYPTPRSIQLREADRQKVLKISDEEVEYVLNALDELDEATGWGEKLIKRVFSERQVSELFRNYGLADGEILYEEFVARDETYGLKGSYLSRNYRGDRLMLGKRLIYRHRDIATLRDTKSGRSSHLDR